MEYKRPNDHHDATYWTTRIVVDPTEDEDEVQMVSRASMAGRARPIVLDGDDEEEKKKPTPHRCSMRLEGRRG